MSVRGEQNAQISLAQKALHLSPDGVFGQSTYAALVLWQARLRVPITGVLDKATCAKLVPTPPAPSVPAPPAKPPTPPPVVTPPAAPSASSVTPFTAYKSVVLRQGSRGVAVAALQRALKATPDGEFGPKTRAALVTFQTLQHISPTGVVDRLVWDRLEKRDYPLLGYRGLTLKQGSKGVAVVALQRALHVAPDGVFGPLTMTAVKVVQVAAKLAPTGVVSGSTWVAVERQIRR